MPNWAQNAPLFAELTQQIHHFLRVLVIFLPFLEDFEGSITHGQATVNIQ